MLLVGSLKPNENNPASNGRMAGSTGHRSLSLDVNAVCIPKVAMLVAGSRHACGRLKDVTMMQVTVGRELRSR
jgi:hypothetical protein